MTFLIVLGLAVALMAIAFAGLAIKILVEKKGEFPNLHIGANENMKARGVTCAQTFDKMEQAKAYGELKFKDLNLVQDEPGSC